MHPAPKRGLQSDATCPGSSFTPSAQRTLNRRINRDENRKPLYATVLTSSCPCVSVHLRDFAFSAIRATPQPLWPRGLGWNASLGHKVISDKKKNWCLRPKLEPTYFGRSDSCRSQFITWCVHDEPRPWASLVFSSNSHLAVKLLVNRQRNLFFLATFCSFFIFSNVNAFSLGPILVETHPPARWWTLGHSWRHTGPYLRPLTLIWQS